MVFWIVYFQMNSGGDDNMDTAALADGNGFNHVSSAIGGHGIHYRSSPGVIKVNEFPGYFIDIVQQKFGITGSHIAIFDYDVLMGIGKSHFSNGFIAQN